MAGSSDHRGDAGAAKSFPIRDLLDDYQSLPDEQRTPELLGLHVLAVLAAMSNRDPSAAVGANGCWSRLTWAIPAWLSGGPRWIRLAVERQTARSRRASLAAQRRWKRQRKALWIPPALWSDASRGGDVLRLCVESGIIASSQTAEAAGIMRRLKEQGASAALFVHAIRGMSSAATTGSTTQPVATPTPVNESETDPLFGPSARGLRLEAQRNGKTNNQQQAGCGKPPQRRQTAPSGGNDVAGQQPDPAGPGSGNEPARSDAPGRRGGGGHGGDPLPAAE